MLPFRHIYIYIYIYIFPPSYECTYSRSLVPQHPFTPEPLHFFTLHPFHPKTLNCTWLKDFLVLFWSLVAFFLGFWSLSPAYVCEISGVFCFFRDAFLHLFLRFWGFFGSPGCKKSANLTPGDAVFFAFLGEQFFLQIPPSAWICVVFCSLTA